MQLWADSNLEVLAYLSESLIQLPTLLILAFILPSLWKKMNANVNCVPVVHTEQAPVQTELQNLPRVQLEPHVQHDDPTQPQLLSEGEVHSPSAAESQLQRHPVAELQQEVPQIFHAQPPAQVGETFAPAAALVPTAIRVQPPVAEVSALAPARVSGQVSMPVPVMIPEPVNGVVLTDSFVNTQEYAQESTFAASSMIAPSGGAFSDLQARAKLAASRVHLMDATLDILVTTFKSKYALDKELEKRCAKFVNAAEFETSDRELNEDLQILAGSFQWVKENLRYLEECLDEKHRNVRIAGPLVDASHERKKEDKQVRHIEKIAKKIEERAARREKNEVAVRAKASEARLVEDAWRHLPSLADNKG